MLAAGAPLRFSPTLHQQRQERHAAFKDTERNKENRSLPLEEAADCVAPLKVTLARTGHTEVSPVADPAVPHTTF